MADGAYERRGPREAELRHLERVIAETRRRRADASADSRGAGNFGIMSKKENKERQ
jgi:hypothetical protein